MAEPAAKKDVARSGTGSKPGSGLGVWRVVLSVAACLLLIAGAGATTYLIYTTEPQAQSEAATRRSAALVETIEVTSGTHRPRLSVLGMVEPARDIVLSPRVSGRLIGVDPSFAPGGLVEEGQLLVTIDPADFEQVLRSRMSAKKQVEASLAIEQGRQAVARQEYELLGDGIDPSNRSLILREPQIESIMAQLESAEAAVEQARLDLERTTVKAPFDAQILTRPVNIGSQVTPGDDLARLVGVDEYWIMASVPLRDLRWVTFPRDNGRGSEVEVRHTTAWEPGESRLGRVAALIGSVDPQSRLARVRVSVQDPLARETDGPALILGTIVELEIEGEPLTDVVRLDREYLRQNNTVWVMTEGELDIREVEVVFSDALYVYIRGGLEAGEDVVTTSLATVTDGLPLRREGETQRETADASEPDDTSGNSL